MELMKEAAMTNEAAVGQAKANYYSLLTSVPTLKESISQTENALCTLLHEAPHAIERGTFDADAFPASFSKGVPLQLLANRPDVNAAELQLASSFYDVNIARASFYPPPSTSRHRVHGPTVRAWVLSIPVRFWPICLVHWHSLSLPTAV